jgi:GT2 family glycosyltransferase
MIAAIIICTRNNESSIARCLESVRKQTLQDFCCIVVDDNSSDNTRNIILEKFPWVQLVEKRSQSGPSINRNVAIGMTSSKFIATIDSDVALEKNWLFEQVKFLQKNKNAGIAASKILFFWNNQKVNSCGGCLTMSGFGYNRLAGEDASGNFLQANVMYAHSAAMLMRRQMISEIGAFDESFFYGHEDTDLGWRANTCGWEVIFNPKAVAFHEENGTVKNMPKSVAFHGTKNRIRSIIKNYSCPYMLLYLCVHMAMVFGNAMISSCKTEKLKAIGWNTANFWETIKERRKIQAKRKCGDVRLKKMMSIDSAFAPKPIIYKAV